MRRLVIFALILAGVGYGCVQLGARGAAAVEKLLTVRVASGLNAIGLDWAEVSADGLRLRVSGHAPDMFARDLALETARKTAPIAEVQDYMTVSLAPPPQREPVRVELLRDASGLTLTGRFHGEKMRERLLEGIAAAAPKLALHDLTGVNGAWPGRNWGPELDVAIAAAAEVPNAYIRIQPGAVRVEGLARSEAQRQALSARLMRLAEGKLRLTLELHLPLQVAVPFEFSAVKEGPGKLLVESCSARDPDEQAAIEALLARAGADPGRRRCPAALGGPPGDWPGAIAAGLDALRALPAGRYRLEYRVADLAADDSAEAQAMAGARARLAADLPKGFSLDPETPAARAHMDIATQQARYWMRLTRDADGVTLAGLMPPGPARGVVETHAAARFGGAAVHPAFAPGPPAAPEDWESAALAVLDALADAQSGEAQLALGEARVTATVASPEDAARLQRGLVAALPKGYVPSTRITVALPAQVAAVPPDGARCAVLLAALLKRRPIAFAPGSAVIADQSQPVLDKVAGLLQRCPAARFEIGGHTDNQGSESFNMRLSQGRAEAVLDGLLARGVRLHRLVARGYGEQRPVASNKTEAGRARNRRIELTLIPAGGEETAAGPAAAGEQAADGAAPAGRPDNMPVPRDPAEAKAARQAAAKTE